MVIWNSNNFFSIFSRITKKILWKEKIQRSPNALEFLYDSSSMKQTRIVIVLYKELRIIFLLFQWLCFKTEYDAKYQQWYISPFRGWCRCYRGSLEVDSCNDIKDIHNNIYIWNEGNLCCNLLVDYEKIDVAGSWF